MQIIYFFQDFCQHTTTIAISIKYAIVVCYLFQNNNKIYLFIELWENVSMQITL